jgi:hypothetical protein
MSMPAILADGSEVVLEAYYNIDGKTVKSQRSMTVNGGVPYESPLSTIYVVAMVAVCVFLVSAASIIAFTASKRHTKKTNAQ